MNDEKQPDNSIGYQNVMTLIEMCEPFIAGVASYKRKLVDAGFSAEAAEEMAVQFHERLVSGIGS